MFDFIQKVVNFSLVATFAFVLLVFLSVNPIMAVAMAAGAGLICYNVKFATNTYKFFSKSGSNAKTREAFFSSPRSESITSRKSSYEIVIENCKDLEGRLAKMGAEGKGLHEKTSSISAVLCPELVKKLRAVATIRNKLIHEEDFVLTKNELDDFEDLAYSAYRQLRSLPSLPKVSTHLFTCSNCMKTDIAHITMKQAVPLFAHCQHCGEKLDLESTDFSV